MVAPRGIGACLLFAGLWAGLSAGPITGCGGGADDERVVVFAASSLTDAFESIEHEFERANPGIDVVTNFGGSSSLVAQLADGAPANVLATADEATMERATAASEPSGEPVVFAHNSLVIAVEAGNPLGVEGLADLVDVPIVVLAAPEVPAGAYAAQVLARAGVEIIVASYEQNVRSVVSKVALGEADAGIVYRTDVIATGAVEAVEIDAEANVDARYSIVAVTDDDGAESFVDFVRGDTGQRVLAEAGFGSP